MNPDLQEKLRSEINEAVETNARKKPLYEIAHNIEYLDCVIKESQRLNPPVAFANRESHQDFNLNGIHITKERRFRFPYMPYNMIPMPGRTRKSLTLRDSEAPLKIPSTPSSSCPSVPDPGIVSG